MKPDEEKKIPEAPKSGETLPEGALEGVSGGGLRIPRYGPLVPLGRKGEQNHEA